MPKPPTSCKAITAGQAPSGVNFQGSRKLSPYLLALQELEERTEKWNYTKLTDPDHENNMPMLEYEDAIAKNSVYVHSKKAGIPVLMAEHNGKLYVRIAPPQKTKVKTEPVKTEADHNANVILSALANVPRTLEELRQAATKAQLNEGAASIITRLNAAGKVALIDEGGIKKWRKVK